MEEARLTGGRKGNFINPQAAPELVVVSLSASSLILGNSLAFPAFSHIQNLVIWCIQKLLVVTP